MNVRRLARVMTYAGIVGVVVGLSVSTPRSSPTRPYTFTDSFRFAWAIAYIGLLILAAYGIGLPDIPRGARSAVGAAAGASAAAALGDLRWSSCWSATRCSLGSSSSGRRSSSCPGTCSASAVAVGGRARAEERDRVVIVAGQRRGRHPASGPRDPARNGPRTSSPCSRRTRRRRPAATRRPLIDAVTEHGATVIVLDRDAQVDESIVAPGGRSSTSAASGSGRCRSFYEQWLGKLPLSELERVSLLFDIGEVHDSRYGRIKRLVDVAFAAGRVRGLRARHPVRAARQPRLATGARSSTRRCGSARTARCSRS